MSNYSFNSTVSSKEAEALKEMIFKRARERAQALNEDTQKNYTTNIQSEVMEIARDSFSVSKNPFTKIVETEQEKVQNNTTKKEEEIGFAQRNIEEIKAQIYYRNKNNNTNIANKEIASVMDDARITSERKQSFIGALDFLNSQASISLIKNRGKSFEAIA